MLTVTNANNPDMVVEFTAEDLQQLAQFSFSTATDYTDGQPEFSGPLARDVLEMAGLGDATMAVMTAANDYSVEVPISDLTNYNVILAMSMNGKRLSRRDKGPIWLMYPISQHEELEGPETNARLIWQMVRIELR